MSSTYVNRVFRPQPDSGRSGIFEFKVEVHNFLLDHNLELKDKNEE